VSTGWTPARVETGFWLAVCAVLVATIGSETDWGRQLRPPAPRLDVPAASYSPPVLTEPYRLPAADQYLGVSMRPLFIVSRRPAPLAPVAEAAKPSMQRGQFLLTGTLVLPDGKFAFLFEKSANKSRVVAEGKEINGIRVASVGADRVVLQQYDDSETLELKTAVAPLPVAQAPVPPPPAAQLPGASGGPLRPPIFGGLPPAGAAPGMAGGMAGVPGAVPALDKKPPASAIRIGP
jgi:hypothetical protein